MSERQGRAEKLTGMMRCKCDTLEFTTHIQLTKCCVFELCVVNEFKDCVLFVHESKYILFQCTHSNSLVQLSTKLLNSILEEWYECVRVCVWRRFKSVKSLFCEQGPSHINKWLIYIFPINKELLFFIPVYNQNNSTIMWISNAPQLFLL